MHAAIDEQRLHELARERVVLRVVAEQVAAGQPADRGLGRLQQPLDRLVHGSDANASTSPSTVCGSATATTSHPARRASSAVWGPIATTGILVSNARAAE